MSNKCISANACVRRGLNVLKFPFWETAFVGMGCTCLIDAPAQLPRTRQLLLTRGAQLLTFNKKSCIVSGFFCEPGQTLAANTPCQA